MRTQGLKTQSYKTKGTHRRFILCLLLCALVLLVSSHFKEKMGIPPLFSLSPQATAAPQATKSPQQKESYSSCDISMTARSWYALQLGAFTQESAAMQLSAEFIPRGAAGYVCRDDDIYRVYAAAYPTRAEAQSVQTRLSAQGVTTYIQPCTEDAFTLRATGTQTQLSAVKDVFSYLDSLSMKFYALSGQLDKSELTAADALSALMSEAHTCRALAEAFTNAFPDTLPNDAQSPIDLLLSIAQSCESVQNSQSAARIGAALKSSQFSVIFGIRDLIFALTP